jgi:toxin FitB
MFLIDTCVLSEAARPRPAPKVDRWLKERETTDLFVSAMTVGELRYGINRLAIGRRRETLDRWLSEVIVIGFADRVVAFDHVAATHWAAIRAVNPNASTVDSQIAAMALARGLTLVTRNVKDFTFAGLSVLNPWED